jgi:hypothetical protein
MDSVTSFSPTDLFWLNTKPSSAFVNRKVSWTYLRSNMIDYIDGLANTWALKQTYSSGATFSAGSNGGVTFNDSTYFPTSPTIIRFQKPLSLVSLNGIGSAAEPYDAIYSQNFVMVNTEANDSVYLSYDDSTLTINKTVEFANLTVTTSVTVDSGASFRQVIYEPNTYLVPAVSDTVLRLNAANKYSLSIIDLPGNVTSPGISHFDVDGATIGFIARLVVMDATFTITFKNFVGNDDNLYIATDFTGAGIRDYIELMCVVATADAQVWIETGRTAN